MLKAARECGADVRVLDYEERADVAIEGKRWKKVSIAKDVLEEGIKFVWLSKFDILLRNSHPANPVPAWNYSSYLYIGFWVNLIATILAFISASKH